MLMNWTPEKNAKPSALSWRPRTRQKSNLKLNYKCLVEYMGPDCTQRAIEHQIAKLKKQAAQNPNIQSAAAASAPPTPAVMPQKRGAGGTPAEGGSVQRKKKNQVHVAGGDKEDDTEEWKQAL
ncbi:hypothetical protein BJX63DRAFT_435206 [Aspergillus granulosus]|uniref:Uncharacterized protein n=1 Tax=Aspergillus granulosus TaxID=176169 RepID=A0ABR4H1W9_9EURO